MSTVDVERFYRRHAGIYDATRRLYLFDRRLAVQLLDVRPGHHVADFGCGTGLNFPHLARRDPARITGVDFSEAMLERARSKAARARVLRDDVATVELPEPADRILCTYALSMVPAWRETLRNMHRQLRPGGVLVLLDFHELEGALGFLNRPWRRWLARFGVEPGRDVTPVLDALFERVEVTVRRSGYDVLVRASGPL